MAQGDSPGRTRRMVWHIRVKPRVRLQQKSTSLPQTSTTLSWLAPVEMAPLNAIFKRTTVTRESRRVPSGSPRLAGRKRSMEDAPLKSIVNRSCVLDSPSEDDHGTGNRYRLRITTNICSRLVNGRHGAFFFCVVTSGRMLALAS